MRLNEIKSLSSMALLLHTFLQIGTVGSCWVFVSPPGPGPQFVFTGPGPQFVFTGPGSQCVFTSPGTQFVFACSSFYSQSLL